MGSKSLVNYFLFLLAIPLVQMLRVFRKIHPQSINRTLNPLQLRMASVLNMSSKELLKILQDKSERAHFQVVDVREADELQIAKLPDKDVVHMPLSESHKWAEEVIEGTSSLEKDKATVCVCHHGMRSKRMADFLGKLFFL